MALKKLRMICAGGDKPLAEWDTETVRLALPFGCFFTGDFLQKSSIKIGMFKLYRWFENFISTHLPTLNQIN